MNLKADFGKAASQVLLGIFLMTSSGQTQDHEKGAEQAIFNEPEAKEHVLDHAHSKNDLPSEPTRDIPKRVYVYEEAKSDLTETQKAAAKELAIYLKETDTPFELLSCSSKGINDDYDWEISWERVRKFQKVLEEDGVEFSHDKPINEEEGIYERVERQGGDVFGHGSDCPPELREEADGAKRFTILRLDPQYPQSPPPSKGKPINWGDLFQYFTND